MKKIIRLTERDLARIVKRVIKENMDDLGLPTPEKDSFEDHSQNKFLKFMQDEIDEIAHESYDINDFDEMIEEFFNKFDKELNNLSDRDYRTLEVYIDDVSSNIRMSDYGDKDHYRGW